MRMSAVFIAGMLLGAFCSLIVSTASRDLGPDVSYAQQPPGAIGWDYLIWEHKPIRRHPDLVAADYDSLGAEGWQLVQVMPEIDQSIFARLSRR